MSQLLPYTALALDDETHPAPILRAVGGSLSLSATRRAG